MILLYGIPEDSPISLVRDHLNRAGAHFHFLDHRDIFNSKIEYTLDKKQVVHTTLYAPGATIDFSEVTAAYTRPYNFMDYPAMEGKTINDPIAIAAMGFESQLMASLDASNAFVVNKSEAAASNNSKPYQLSVIEAAGFNIPITLITNEPDEARDFIRKHKDCIYKSISGVRSIVKRIGESHYEYLDDVSWCPTLFQKVVDGTNYRVHVIRDEVFAVRIESDNLDYRYGNTRMFPEELPVEIAEKCRQLNSLWGLHLSGIDLMRTPDNEWYCFEVNTSPAYSYFEQISGVHISAAIAKVLIEIDSITKQNSL